ncbi:uncharacterized protein LOC115631874 [Scaptodrosophila lebanonensis]|uniref:Uncharacterized protein LOC115631874 n=1 Tax=Drosophila lebanonensis TaxID=7225 RepID=A0A6J2UAT5_DROLE|nr:uncharacterized protein LOC115631874 [Scaptodrosophila lebanonensis]
MTSSDLLIVTPTKLTFQAPFPHAQKRLISLLNPTGQPLLYHMQPSNEEFYAVEPTSGTLAPFDTTELTITLKSISGELPDCCFDVKYVAERDGDIVAPDWYKNAQHPTANVSVCLDNSEADYANASVRLRMQLNNGYDPNELLKTIEKQYKPVCGKCAMKREQMKTSFWQSRAFWIALIFFAAAFYVFKNHICAAFSLFSEPGY